MALTAGILALLAANEARLMLGDSAQQFGDGGPEYIKSGQPQSIAGKIGQAAARSACRRYAEGDFDGNPEASGNYEKACRPYLDDIGYGQPPTIKVPFEGGQCPGTIYNVEVTGTIVNPPTNQTFEANLTGPLTYSRDNGNPNDGGCSDGLTFNQFLIAGSDGGSVISWQGCGATLTVNRVVPLFGGPNDCGNPPPDVVSPVPPVDPDSPEEPFNPSPDIDINLDVTVNLDGSINIDIGTGPIVINPFSGGDGDGDSGGGGPDDSPPNPEPGPELPGGNGGFGGDDPFGEPPAGRRWVGCCLRITSNPSNQPPIPGTPPEDVYASVIGNVRLVYDASGTRQTDTPVRIQARKVCVWEAVRKLNPVGVSVDIQPGFGYVYRPYSVPLDA